MIEIYLKKESMDLMDKNELYTLIQTTRIINFTKMFIVICNRYYSEEGVDPVKEVEYLELLLHHAASLYAVLETIQKDLLEYYDKCISTEMFKKIDNIITEKKKNKSMFFKILRDIRNKHSFHIGWDPNYIKSTLKDGPSNKNKLIGKGNSTVNNDFYYTVGIEFLSNYLYKTHKITESQLSDFINKDIYKFTIKLYKIFEEIEKELFSDNVFILKK